MATHALNTGFYSRPIRLAARLRDEPDDALEHLFISSEVLVRLEDAFADLEDAHETFIAIVNQVARFCPNISLCIPGGSNKLFELANQVIARIYGPKRCGRIQDIADAHRFAAVINVGRQILNGLPSATVNSTGWVARIATGSRGCAVDWLPWMPRSPNAIGAVGAACLGAAHAFGRLAGIRLLQTPIELSLFTLGVGILGTLAPGPDLPRAPLELDAFLVGCGAVSNGWAYTVKRLPVVGKLQAIDRQSLRVENLGPYLAADQEWIDKPKAEMIASFLRPAIEVTPRSEEWEFFKLRLKYGIAIPALIVNGLDNVDTRHSVQRIWPEILVDMAARELSSQAIVTLRGTDDICLLGAFQRPMDEVGWAERIASETGLSPDRISRYPTSAITEADVASAPMEKRESLEKAREERRAICGRVTEQNLEFERYDPNFTPAAPFVTGLSGVIGAAATMKWLMGRSDIIGFHYQFNLLSNRSLKLRLKCEDNCECQSAHVSHRR